MRIVINKCYGGFGLSPEAVLCVSICNYCKKQSRENILKK
jgi:hypothetical protein